jgi:hypothetical protein
VIRHQNAMMRDDDRMPYFDKRRDDDTMRDDDAI